MEPAKKIRKLNPNRSGDNDSIPVRTIYIAPLKPNMDTEIKGYFERFGEVKSVDIRVKNAFRYAFVQFKSTEAAQSVLINSQHDIENCPVNVKAADSWHQPPHILNALNDDCLREVLKHLNLLDLSNAANVCICFNELAKEVFSSNDKHCDLSRGSKFYGKPDETEMMLSTFGSMLQSLDVESGLLGDKHERELHVISRYCTQLKVLTLSNYKFHFVEDIETLQSMFAKLERIYLKRCEDGSILKDLLVKCVELRSLSLKDCGGIRKSIQQQFVKIEAAFFDRFPNNKELNCFMTLNPTLTRLVIENHIAKSTIVRCIAQNLPNLRELTFYFGDVYITTETFQIHILSLANLKFLNKLRLDFNCGLFSPLMRALASNEIPIKELVIHWGEIDDDSVESLSQLKQIQILELHYMASVITDEHLIELAKKLPQLQKLYLTNPPITLTTIGLKKMLPYASNLSYLYLSTRMLSRRVTIDECDYKVMLKIVQNRANNTKLEIELKDYDEKVNIPNGMTLENRKFLHIKEGITADANDDSDDLNIIFEESDSNTDD